jgi:predicted GIY-YIG superfamily endonuclease
MYVVYLITNERGNSYIGSTNDPERRLRQHNGEISGGAKATRGKGPWSYVAYITCEEKCLDHSFMLSLEWHCKHPLGKNKRIFGSQARLNAIKNVFKHPKFVGLTFQVYCSNNLFEAFSDDIKSYINVSCFYMV